MMFIGLFVLSMQALLLLSDLLLGVCLRRRLRLLMGVATYHHHGEQGTTNLAQQTTTAKNQIASGNEATDTESRHLPTTEIIEEISKHIHAIATEDIAKEIADTLQCITECTKNALGLAHSVFEVVQHIRSGVLDLLHCILSSEAVHGIMRKVTCSINTLS